MRLDLSFAILRINTIFNGILKGIRKSFFTGILKNIFKSISKGIFRFFFLIVAVVSLGVIDCGCSPGD